MVFEYGDIHVHMQAHILFHNVCVSPFAHTKTGGSSVSEIDLEDNDVILVCGIVLYFLI
jgi:uridine kinase